jgi:hypothetical protein
MNCSFIDQSVAFMRVGAGNTVTSCDLGIFVDQAAEPISPQNPDISAWGWCVRRSGGRILVECPVGPTGVVMVEVLAQDQPQVSVRR